MANIYIHELNKDIKNRSIIVKILRAWLTKDVHKKDSGMEAIVMDNEGMLIAACGGRNAIKHMKNMSEGETVSIQHFNVEENGVPTFPRTRVKHGFKLVLLFKTKIEAVRPDAVIPLSGIRLVPFDALKCHDPAFFVDVIGRITKMGEISIVERTKARRMEVEIQDERGSKLKVTLWEAHADRVKAACANKGMDGGVTIILQFGQKYIWNHEIHVQTTYHPSKLYINDDMPEIKDFNCKKQEGGDSLTSITLLSSETRKLSDDEWLNKERHRTPKEVEQCTMEGSYILFLNFEDLDEDSDWYYDACSKCTAGVKDRKVGEPCAGSKCNGQPIEAIIPKVKVLILAKSPLDEYIKLVLFEKIVTQLTGFDTKTLIESASDNGDPRIAPDELMCMLNKDYLCQVRVNKGYNLARGNKDFTVEIITDDAVLIDKYISATHGEGQHKLTVFKEVACKGKEKEAEEDSSNGMGNDITPLKRSTHYISDDDEVGSNLKFDRSTTKTMKISNP